MKKSLLIAGIAGLALFASSQAQAHVTVFTVTGTVSSIQSRGNDLALGMFGVGANELLGQSYTAVFTTDTNAWNRKDESTPGASLLYDATSATLTIGSHTLVFPNAGSSKQSSLEVMSSPFLTLTEILSNVTYDGGWFDQTIYSRSNFFTPDILVPVSLHGVNDGGALLGGTDIQWANNGDFLRLDMSATSMQYDVTLIPVAPAPEPATWAMMITGLFGLGAMLRRKKAMAAVAV